MDTLDGRTNKHLANTDKQGGTHWTERLTNIDTQPPCTNQTERLIIIWLTQTVTGGGTHRTERLTNFWLTQTHRGDAQDGKTNKHTAL